MHTVVINDRNTKYRGRVKSVRGTVVDVLFEEEPAPVYGLLYAGDNQQIVLEVMDHVDEQTARCIALTPTAGLGRGDLAQGSGAPIMVPVGEENLGRMFNVFGETIDKKTEPVAQRKKSIHQHPIALADRVPTKKYSLPALKP